MEAFDIVIIGAGPAGLAAAAEAKRRGAKRVLVLERNPVPGGILNQCIHDGFGVTRFGEALSGPEYVARFLADAESLGVEIRCGTMVLRVSPERVVTCAARGGQYTLRAGAIVLATGCRERTRGAIGVPGTRPAGIYTAGVVQHLVNLQNIAVGKRAVILGSGDIGLIMARRLTLEGMEVPCVLEKLPYCSGLPRNVRQCLDDYGIPLRLATTVVDIEGMPHLTAVVAAEVDETGTPKMETTRRIPCDTLILSVGLIPENELARACGVAMDPITGGARVDGRLMTSVPGIFSCGNALHVHDLVDMVSAEAETAAAGACAYLAGAHDRPLLPVTAGEGVRYVLPRTLAASTETTLSLRVRAPGRAQSVLVRAGETLLAEKKLLRLTPAEMIRIPLPALSADTGPITVTLRQDEDARPSVSGANEMICTVCPNGCTLLPVWTEQEDGARTLAVEGARCKRGRAFCECELTDPRRTLTTTIRILGGELPLVPVRSEGTFPKAKLRELVRSLNARTLSAPLAQGETAAVELDVPLLVSRAVKRAD